jgi:hypothetical protein
MSEKLQVVRHYVCVGLNLPPLTRFPRPARWLARLAARAVRYLSRVVTDWQREYNQAVLQVLEEIDQNVARIDQAQRQLQARWDQYAQAVHHHASLLEQHALSLQQQQALLQRHAALLDEHEIGLEAVQAAAEEPWAASGAAAAPRDAVDGLRQELLCEHRRLNALAEQIRRAAAAGPCPACGDDDSGRAEPAADACALREGPFAERRDALKGHSAVA